MDLRVCWLKYTSIDKFLQFVASVRGAEAAEQTQLMFEFLCRKHNERRIHGHLWCLVFFLLK